VIQTVEIRTDDLDHKFTTHKQTKDLVETISFDLDGESYQIDLSAKHAAELRAVYKTYIDAGRRAANGNAPKGTRTRPATRASRNGSNGHGATTEEIRQWAKAEGYDVKDRGRVSSDLAVKFRAAHS
jgi:Lsr2